MIILINSLTHFIFFITQLPEWHVLGPKLKVHDQKATEQQSKILKKGFYEVCSLSGYVV